MQAVNVEKIMNNVITIDTETLDIKPSAVVLSIGGFAFDVTNYAETQSSILAITCDQKFSGYSVNAFYGLVDTFDQLMMGRSVSRETQQWWRSQGEGAHEALIGERNSLGDQLLNLSSWISQHREARIFF